MSVVKIKSIESLNRFFELLNDEGNGSRCTGHRYDFDDERLSDVLYNLINLRKYFGDINSIEIEVEDQTRFIMKNVTNSLTLNIQEVDSLTFKLKKV